MFLVALWQPIILTTFAEYTTNSKEIHSTAAHIRLCVLVCVSLKKLEETDYFLL